MGKRIVVFVAACGLCLASSAATIDQNWDSRFVFAPGLNGKVFSMTALGTNLYIGGWFSSAGVPNTGGIACWDGAAWHSVGGGIDGVVFALETDGTNLYVGGDFDSAGGVSATNVAKWNGTNWSSLGGLDLGEALNAHEAAVYCLAQDGANLFAGGTFFRAGGILATNVARWDGHSWHSLGDGLGTAGALDDHFAVYDLAKHGTNLYATGRFFTSGSFGVTNLARWNGSLWEQAGDGLRDGQTGYFWREAIYYGYGQALCSTPQGLLVGGDFTIGSQNTTNLALWDGTNWSSVGGGGAPTIVRIKPDGTNQIVLGEFSEIGGTAAHGVVLLSAGVWQPLGQGVVPAGIAATRVGTNLYVGGDFQIAGGQSAGFVARWDGVDLKPLLEGEGTAPLGDIGNLAFDANGNLYAVGNFQTVGHLVVNNVAKYDGTNWSALANGFPGSYVSSLAVVGTNVYVGGNFVVPSTEARGIARWTGSQWDSLSNGVYFGGYASSPIALADGTTNLFVAGSLFVGTNVIATNLSSWDGSQWKSLDYPISNAPGWLASISAITAQGDVLFACQQDFSLSGEPAQVQVKCWDGSQWTNVGSSFSYGSPSGNYPTITSLVCAGTNLFIGGHFAVTNGFTATNIARWDGASWSGLSQPFGENTRFSPMGYNGTNLFAVIHPYGVAAAEIHIAKWDGANWKLLGTGITRSPSGPQVSSLAVRGRDVFVGGGFSSAGGKPADNLALWHDFPEVTLASRGWQLSGRFGLRILGGNGQAVRLQTSTNLQSWIDLGQQLPNSDSFDLEDTAGPTGTTRFYRLLLLP